MEQSNGSRRRIHASQGRLRQFSVDIFQFSKRRMKAGQNSHDQVMAQGLVSKGKLRDVPQLEIVYEKEELSLKDSLCLDPLKK